jgi:hypothetical protein
MEWQPIETAPKGELIIMAGWKPNKDGDCLVWSVNTGFAWEYFMFPFAGGKHLNTALRKGYTHWKPLPPPPA